MNHRSFMVATSLIAFLVAGVALLSPEALLTSKGVELGAPVVVWVREVGVMILAAGLTTFLARKSTDPIALRAVLHGSAALHSCLLPIELIAYANGVITKASGVVPNSLLHVAVALGSFYFARAVREPAPLHDRPPFLG